MKINSVHTCTVVALLFHFWQFCNRVIIAALGFWGDTMRVSEPLVVHYRGKIRKFCTVRFRQKLCVWSRVYFGRLNGASGALWGFGIRKHIVYSPFSAIAGQSGAFETFPIPLKSPWSEVLACVHVSYLNSPKIGIRKTKIFARNLVECHDLFQRFTLATPTKLYLFS